MNIDSINSVSSYTENESVKKNDKDLTHLLPSQHPVKAEPLQAKTVTLLTPPSAYHEIVRRGTKAELKDLETKLSNLPKKQKHIEQLLEALREGKWKSSIFQNKDYPYYALEAVKQGKLSPQEFATVQIFWEVEQAHPNKQHIRVPLFNPDGSVNPFARFLIEQTTKTKPKKSQYFAQLYFDSEKQVDRLIEEMKKLPKSQQIMWAVLDVYTKKNDSNRDFFDEGFNIFGKFKTLRLVPSFGLMQTYLYIKFGDHAVLLNPVLGLSSEKDIIKNGKNFTRDMGFHHPAIALPHTADNFSAKWYSFFYHDFFHAIYCSAVPSEMRPILAELANVLRKVLKTCKLPPQQENRLRGLMAQWMDQFVFEFINNKTASINALFWNYFDDDVIDELAGIKRSVKNFILFQIVSKLVQVPQLEEGPPETFKQYDSKTIQTFLNYWTKLKT